MKVPLFHDRDNEGWRPLQLLVPILIAVAIALCSGCSTPEPAVASAPPAEWLVEQTAWAWVAGQPEEEYADREEFFEDPPTHVVLLNLQERSQKYGYDFETLRAQAWEMVESVEHVGE